MRGSLGLKHNGLERWRRRAKRRAETRVRFPLTVNFNKHVAVRPKGEFKGIDVALEKVNLWMSHMDYRTAKSRSINVID